MKKLTWMLGSLLVVGMAAVGQDQPRPARDVAAARATAERLEGQPAFFRRAGKLKSAESTQGAAPALRREALAPMRVYVPGLELGGLSRAEALQLTEILTKGIEEVTRAKVVATPAEADYVLEATLKPGARPKP